MWSYTRHDEKVIEAYSKENNFCYLIKDYNPVRTFKTLVSRGVKLLASQY